MRPHWGPPLRAVRRLSVAAVALAAVALADASTLDILAGAAVTVTMPVSAPLWAHSRTAAAAAAGARLGAREGAQEGAAAPAAAPFEVCLAVHDDESGTFVDLQTLPCRSYAADGTDDTDVVAPSAVAFHGVRLPLTLADRGARRRQLLLAAAGPAGGGRRGPRAPLQLGEPRSVRVFAHATPGNATTVRLPFGATVEGLGPRRSAVLRLPPGAAAAVDLAVASGQRPEAVWVTVYDAGVGEGEPLDPPVLMADADRAVGRGAGAPPPPPPGGGGPRSAAAYLRRLQRRVVYASSGGAARRAGLEARTGLWVAVFNADPQAAVSFTVAITATGAGDAVPREADDGFDL